MSAALPAKDPVPRRRPSASPTVRRLRAMDDEQVDAFLRSRPFPVLDGDALTFVYRGEAEAVELVMWVYGAPGRIPFSKMRNRDLWYLVLILPEGARIEYKLAVRRGGKEELILDPLNPYRAHDPFGANSVAVGPGYRRPEWSRRRSGVPRGTWDRSTVRSDRLGDERDVRLYLPAGRHERLPLLVVHDGSDFLAYADMEPVLDNLIADGVLAPTAVAFIDPNDRLVEYGAYDPHADFLVEELVPHVAERLEGRGTALAQDRIVLLGASFGAVAALHAAWRHSGRVRGLVLYSGSFVTTAQGRGPEFVPVVEWLERFRAEPRHPADRAYVSVGVYESLVHGNRHLVPVLREAGVDVRYDEVLDGHHWHNWRDRCADAFAWVLPGRAVETDGAPGPGRERPGREVVRS